MDYKMMYNELIDHIKGCKTIDDVKGLVSYYEFKELKELILIEFNVELDCIKRKDSVEGIKSSASIWLGFDNTPTIIESSLICSFIRTAYDSHFNFINTHFNELEFVINVLMLEIKDYIDTLQLMTTDAGSGKIDVEPISDVPDDKIETYEEICEKFGIDVNIPVKDTDEDED